MEIFKPTVVIILLILCIMLFGASAHCRVRHPRRVPEYRAFIPSHENLVEQNAEIDRLGIPRIQDNKQLAALIQAGALVPVEKSDALRVEIPASRAFLVPWAASFLNQIAAEYFNQFAVPLQVNSAVRTARVQRRLRSWNRNAAPYKGDCASAHMAGIAFDLQRRGLTAAQRRWLQWRLLYYFGRGDVIVEEEIKQPCFHVVVRGSYPTPLVFVTYQFPAQS